MGYENIIEYAQTQTRMPVMYIHNLFQILTQRLLINANAGTFRKLHKGVTFGGYPDSTQ